MTMYYVQKYDKKTETWKDVYSGLVDEKLAIERFNQIANPYLEYDYRLVSLLKVQTPKQIPS